MKIVFNPEACVGCGTCAKVCPQKILVVNDKKMEVIDQKRCMGCFGCEDECPEGAVRMLRASHREAEIHVETAPVGVSACDVAVVGAGPAGPGAAITCAKAGLDVVVFERLPNRKLSHHTDGGMLFAFPEITPTRKENETFSFPGIDITLSADFAPPYWTFRFLGPKNWQLTTPYPRIWKSGAPIKISSSKRL